MSINWEMGVMPNIGQNALAAFDQGRQRRQQQDAQNALATLVQNPNDEAAIGSLAQSDPSTAMKFRQQQQEFGLKQQDQQVAAQKRAQEQMVVMGRLLDHAKDEGSYQQARAAAQQMGIDVSGAPPSFDPNWIGQQRMIMQAYSKDGQQFSGIARELQDAGYQPGSPEFAEAMRGVIQNKYASEYVDERGKTRRRSALNLSPQSGGQFGAPAAPGITFTPLDDGGPTAPPSAGFR